MTVLNVGKYRVLCFIHAAGGTLYNFCDMTAQKHTGRYIYQLVADFLFADNNHLSAAFVTGLVFDFMEDLFHRKIGIDLIPGALDTVVCLDFGCLQCLRIDVGFLLRFIEEGKLFCILKNDLGLLTLLSVKMLFKPGDTFFQNCQLVFQLGIFFMKCGIFRKKILRKEL